MRTLVDSRGGDAASAARAPASINPRATSAARGQARRMSAPGNLQLPQEAEQLTEAARRAASRVLLVGIAKELAKLLRIGVGVLIE